MTYRYRSRKLADVHMVADNCKATKAELRWAAQTCLTLAEQMHDDLKLAEPILDTIRAIAFEEVKALSGDKQ